LEEEENILFLILYLIPYHHLHLHIIRLPILILSLGQYHHLPVLITPPAMNTKELIAGVKMFTLVADGTVAGAQRVLCLEGLVRTAQYATGNTLTTDEASTGFPIATEATDDIKRKEMCVWVIC
jgi:hypothetical protein